MIAQCINCDEYYLEVEELCGRCGSRGTIVVKDERAPRDFDLTTHDEDDAELGGEG